MNIVCAMNVNSVLHFPPTYFYIIFIYKIYFQFSKICYTFIFRIFYLIKGSVCMYFVYNAINPAFVISMNGTFLLFRII